MFALNSFVCSDCGESFPLNTREWRCPCGGLLDIEAPAFNFVGLDRGQRGLWRYRAALPLDSTWQPVSLGEGDTPLLEMEWDGVSVSFKMESMMPTGSFKDRGTSVLITALRGMGIERVVNDSSGNAGASLAAYAALAGIDCEICVPDTAGGPKIAQMMAHGAEVIQIKGKREYAALAAWAAAAHGAYYASHVYSPFFLAGTTTLAYELWEQLDGKAPAAVILPVGNGMLFLGASRGFRRLLDEGLISHMPRLIAVQATGCAPIHRAFALGQDHVDSAPEADTIASGIAIRYPVRGCEILTAVRSSGGTVLAVNDRQIEHAYDRLAARGIYLEKTAAAVVAALGDAHLDLEGTTVVVLTGHGLKSDFLQ